MRSRIFIRGCVRPSVRRSVGPSVTHELKPCKNAVFDQNYYQYARERVYGLVKIHMVRDGFQSTRLYRSIAVSAIQFEDLYTSIDPVF